ncbi:hypothetical protein [Pedobacter nyackensis]|uniref:DUF4352 domain-containing protein n=1 Tax=Pedobacter nyackensis TaxID=475255 RepID=A0A1W2A980_9SPHI|nr:hypothetical protein [Pedobacter nyackensis]SMC57204.1 hypothetical protein SAMN04488101_101327 [Pedobacter nyackensis]
MEVQTAFKISASISAKKSASKSGDAYPISIRIINRSSMDFVKAEVSVKDTESNQHDTAYFGLISANSTSEEILHLPGGIEFCTFRITPRVGEDITGGGIAGNAPGVDITIDD